MKYDIKYTKMFDALTPSEYSITYYDTEAKAFLKEINVELKRMEAERRRELKHGAKQGARLTPIKQMKKRDKSFNFDGYHYNAVCHAAESLGKQHRKVKICFICGDFEITPEIVAEFEKNIGKQKEANK